MKDALRAVHVWDLPVRLFHWSLVVLVIASWASRELDYMEVHRWSGYAILTLVLFRVGWGFAGSRHARFADFVRTPRAMRAYMADILGGAKAQHLGHNPAGGWSVMAILACLLVQAVTGLFVTDEVLFDGPFFRAVSEETAHRLKQLHGINFNILLLLIGLHLAAIAFYRIAKGEDLVRPMLNGRKWVPMDSPAEDVPRVGWWRAPVVLACAAGIVFGVLSLAPGKAW
ncbi:MAG: cytochrome b/b6 domain-containing protein [Gammaproteobacteria bacterium]|jgi:cytochrome b|nr:cytochrome b/b6 domain-containing protein [Gammaproteobacteria bacterium]